MKNENPGPWLEQIIKDFISESPENTLRNPENEKAFDTPIVGFSKGNDPLFEEYREHVGPFHWTPLDIFERTFPETEATPGELTVISWILPQTAATRAGNRKEDRVPCERWARARVFGEEVNNALRKHVSDTLNNNGIPAVAPVLSPHWKIDASGPYGRASTWSERHAAYASGLGTFGLCDGLITPVGKAMRTGSVVARMDIDPTPRPYADHDHHAYCLFFSKGVCGKCIPRCPAGAITEAGKDKVKCMTYIRSVTAEHVEKNYGFKGYGCGLCQTKVPCESKIPLPKDVGEK